MKTFNYNITNKHINTCINSKELKYIQEHDEVLIQVFSGVSYMNIQDTLNDIKQKIPHAKIITTSTDGEIINNIVSVEKVIISISVFRKTKLSLARKENNDYEAGIAIAKELVSEKTKLLIIFLDGINTNGERFLDGIYSYAPDIIIAGGMSGDNGNFVKCYMGIDNTLFTNGCVGVAFDSNDLIVQNLYSFGWDKIGIEHTITKSKDNCVYEIDNMKALDFYRKYLGKESVSSLPSIGMEFPLIYQQDGIAIARAMTANNHDGSLNFAGNLAEGTKIYLGIGDISNLTFAPKSKQILSCAS